MINFLYHLAAACCRPIPVTIPDPVKAVIFVTCPWVQQTRDEETGRWSPIITATLADMAAIILSDRLDKIVAKWAREAQDVLDEAGLYHWHVGSGYPNNSDGGGVISKVVLSAAKDTVLDPGTCGKDPYAADTAAMATLLWGNLRDLQEAAQRAGGWGPCWAYPPTVNGFWLFVQNDTLDTLLLDRENRVIGVEGQLECIKHINEKWQFCTAPGPVSYETVSVEEAKAFF